MSVLGAVLPADGAHAVWLAVDLIASGHAVVDARSADQRRADALVQLAVDALNRYTGCPHCRRRPAHQADGVAADDTDEPGHGSEGVAADDNHEPTRRGSAPRVHGLRPQVQVTVALSTLLGIDDQPGELAGHGPIPAPLARQLAADPSGTWRRLVTDERGRLVDYGRTRYRPPARLRDFVLARDQECMFPGCHRRACGCELDHVHPWAAGGVTDADNLVALCPRHHHAKHDVDR